MLWKNFQPILTDFSIETTFKTTVKRIEEKFNKEQIKLWYY